MSLICVLFCLYTNVHGCLGVLNQLSYTPLASLIYVIYHNFYSVVGINIHYKEKKKKTKLVEEFFYRFLLYIF